MEGHKLIPSSGKKGKGPRDVSHTLYERANDFSNATIIDDELFPWTEIEGERHVGTCGHDT
jgi:hypothetical protein